MNFVESGANVSSRALVPARPREVVLRRRAALARELQHAARSVRLAQSAGLARVASTRVGAERSSAASFWSFANRWLWGSFAALAAIPSLISILYLGLIASDQYVTEARFAVRAGETPTVDTITNLTGMSSLQAVQDSFIVMDYVQSRTIVEELDKRIGLRQMFARPDVDYFSRFDPSDPIEDLVRYWRWKVSTTIEMPSGIVSVAVRAFSAEDSLKIAETVVALSEKLINEISARQQRDLLALAEGEVKRAEQRMRQLRTALRDLRNDERIIDPKLQGEGISRMIEQIRLDRLKMEQELSTVLRSLTEQAPQVQILRSRIQAANEQIALLEGQLTAPTATGDRTVSRAMLRFDELELERQVAEKQYTTALSGLERARINAENQKMYLSTFVRPVLAVESTYPKRFWFSVASVLIFLVLWLAFVGLWTLGRERLAGQ
jgi:capsular polysaccharide transport system permease protein